MQALKKVMATALFGFILATPAVAADKLKVGFITTLTGPGGVIGKHMHDAAELAFDRLGHKIGGLDAELIFVDDQQKPEIGRQVASELITRQRVQFITGVIWSNVMLAVEPLTRRHKTFLISANAGPISLAGKDCSPYFFSASLANDEPPEAVGKHLQDKGIDNVFILVPNYAAGKEDAAGFKRYFKGKIAGEVYFPLGHQDFAAEITQIRNANPSALFLFAPGGMGIQFVKQFEQAGLNGKIPVYSVYSQDAVTLPAQRDAAVGNFEAANWTADLPNPANKDFVSSFQKKYGYAPSWYAAQSYDAIRLIDSAVRAVNGKIKDKTAVQAALKKADFQSVRGSFSFNSNNFPIQTFYLSEIVKEGETYIQKVRETVFTNHRDAHASQCKMASIESAR